MTVSLRSLVSGDLKRLEVKYSVAWPSVGIFLMIFSWLDFGCGFWRGRPQRQSAFSVHPVKGTCCSSELGHLAEEASARFLQGKRTAPSVLHFLEGS